MLGQRKFAFKLASLYVREFATVLTKTRQNMVIDVNCMVVFIVLMNKNAVLFYSFK